MIDLDCPFCKSSITVSRSWIIKNERVFCDSCCKSFEVRLGATPTVEEKKEALNEGSVPDTDEDDWSSEEF